MGDQMTDRVALYLADGSPMGMIWARVRRLSALPGAREHSIVLRRRGDVEPGAVFVMRGARLRVRTVEMLNLAFMRAIAIEEPRP